MVISRAPEPFHRVYSPPEPPPTAGRPALLGVVTAAAASVLAVGTGFLLGFDSGGPEGTASADKAWVGGRPESREQAGPPVTDPSPRLFGSVPTPCSGVTESTRDRLLDRGAAVSRSANTSVAICTFTATGGAVRWLRVETRVFPQASSRAPVEDARTFLGRQWDRAHQETDAHTLMLERSSEPGDEAYHWLKRDTDQPIALAEVAVRLRNAVITIGYSFETTSNGTFAQSEQRALSEAATVARDVLATFR